MVLATALTNTIQTIPDAQGSGGPSVIEWFTSQRGPILPAWGTRERERFLRTLYRADYNWLVMGAFAGVMNQVATTPWELKGPASVSKARKSYYEQALLGMRRKAQTERPDIEYYQQLLRGADFGRGWGSFVKKGVDYLRHDTGWCWEVIAPGDPQKPPTGPVQGLAYLDALRCHPTGDPEYPILYYGPRGDYHLLHHTRVVQLQDMPDGDESRPGYGLCALSRAASIAWQQMLIGQYLTTRLDDKPPPGIMLAKGMVRSEREAAIALYNKDQNTDAGAIYGRQLWLFAADPTIDVSLEAITFAQAPEGFDPRVYTDLNVDALALALGVDRQELMELAGGNIGSATQSEVLHQKSKGKTIGNLRTEIERKINDLLPEEYEFAFQYKDAQEDLERANIAEKWASIVNVLGSNISPAEARVLLANQVDAVRDAITDENGQIRRVGDLDAQPNQAIPGREATVDDATAAQGATPQLPGGQAAPNSGEIVVAAPSAQVSRGGVTVNMDNLKTVKDLLAMGLITLSEAQSMAGQTPDPSLAGLYLVQDFPVPADRVRELWQAHFGRGVAGFEAVVSGASVVADPLAAGVTIGNETPDASAAPDETAQKAIQSTRLDFEMAWEDLLSGYQTGAVKPTRFSILARDILRKYGIQALRDGLEDGGVDQTDDNGAPLALDDTDAAYYTRWLAKQNGYVTDLANEVQEHAVPEAGRAEMWFNKSIAEIYQYGLASADRNGLYEWSLGETEEHCRTCLGMNGQRHRMKDYMRKGVLPQSEALECKGFFCDCRLTRTTGKARGRFPSVRTN